MEVQVKSKVSRRGPDVRSLEIKHHISYNAFDDSGRERIHQSFDLMFGGHHEMQGCDQEGGPRGDFAVAATRGIAVKTLHTKK